MRRVFRRASRAGLVLVVALTTACSSGGDGKISSVGGYLSALPDWAAFSPPLESGKAQVELTAADCPGGAVSSGSCRQTETETDLPVYADDGETILGYQQQDYECTTSRYTLTETPEKMVMFSPDVELLWPGALIQGKSLRDGGVGSLRGLPIAQRTPIKVSIPALANDDNFRQVETPDLAEVNQAIGSMIGAATEADLKTPSTINFTMRTYDSEQEFALNAGFSGKYFGFKASASASVDRTSAERTVAVVLQQKMFEAVVEPPQTPGAFFSADFTPAVLQEQLDLGRIGPDNLPVYVSNIVYGRIMMFTLTSTATETEIKAALNAAYRGLVSLDVNVDTKYRKLLNEARIAITSLGGDAAATEAMIASGDWRSYFYTQQCADSSDPATCAYRPNQAALTTAAPLSYTFRNLGDGSIAKVSEATTYDVRECTPMNPNREFLLTDFDLDPELPVADRLEGWGRIANDLGADPRLDYYVGNCHFFGCMAQDAEWSDPWYFTAPGRYLGNKLDWYGGELSYWIAWACYQNAGLPFWGPPYYDVVLKGGPEGSQLTLMWTHSMPVEEGNPSPVLLAGPHMKYVVPLSNESCDPTAETGSYPGAQVYTPGCWTVAGETVATPADLQYVLQNLVAMEIRGKLGQAMFPNVYDLEHPFLQVTYLDDAKLTKPQLR